MAEWRMFADGEVPFCSTLGYFSKQPRAPHLDQPHHVPRLRMAARFLGLAAGDGALTLSDLGCGDGGLLSLVQDQFDRAWGYDLQPSSAEGWPERGVTATSLDAFGADWGRVKLGDAVAMTEVLEHVADPHGVLARVRENRASRWLVASSPFTETVHNHGEEHCWAWDQQGYAQMIEGAGWTIMRHEECSGMFQVVLARQ